jgi:hypothetical protein
VAYAPTLGARTQSTAATAVADWSCRDATLLRAAEASVVYAAAATRAAATKVNLVMGFLHMMLDAERARLLRPSAANGLEYFITRDHRHASACSPLPRRKPLSAAMVFRHAAVWVDTGVVCATLPLIGKLSQKEQGKGQGTPWNAS